MFKGMTSFSGAATLCLAALSAPDALADCTSVTDSQWECLEAESTAGSGMYEDLTAASGSTPQGPFTFQGSANLYHSAFGSVSCAVTFDAALSISGNSAGMSVTHATITGAGICGTLEFEGFPWTTVVSGADHGDVHDQHGGAPGSNPPNHPHNAFADLAGVTIYYNSIFGPIEFCSGALANVEFGNDVTGTGNKNNPSFFVFDGSIPGPIGSCSISGTVTTAGYRDVNAW